MLETLTAPQTIENMPTLWSAVPVEGTALDLLLRPSPEDAFEWSVSLSGRCTDWRDLESRDQVVGIVQLISTDGDWLIIQSKNLDYLPAGRYAQVMNVGRGYHVEVAHQDGSVVHNWRIGLGMEADDDGNVPYGGPAPSQRLTFAAVTEVLDSWLRGHGIPLGYGAALHVYG